MAGALVSAREKLLEVLLKDPGGDFSVYTMKAESGLGPGTVYPALKRMEEDGLVTSYLEEREFGHGRLVHRYYRITEKGVQELNKKAWNMNAEEFEKWSSTLSPEDRISSLARLSALRQENTAGLKGGAYLAAMRRNRDQVRREHGEGKLPKGYEAVKADPKDIPHAARMASQFSLREEDGRKHFRGTGKVLCWCNCGDTTGWVDAMARPAAEFFREHTPDKELGYRVYFTLGEAAGYSVDTNRMGTYLVHRCGWEKELFAESDLELMNLLLEALDNPHVCTEQK